LEEGKDALKFKESISSASCNIDDIEAIIFGGQSSRFWMLRKCINSMSKKELAELPFYSWNCITFQMANRDIDLVIKKEEDMFLLIKYLAYKIKTIDGIKGSATAAIKEIMKNNKQFTEE
jgi:hypothetical protein